MNRFGAVVGLVLAMGMLAHAAGEPDWVRTLGKSAAHPPSSYLSGFGMSSDDRSISASDKLAYARNAAAGSLVASMQVNVSSEDIVDRFSVVVNNDEELVDQYKSRTVLKSSLNLEGLRFEEYASRRGPTYALAILDRAEAAQHYRTKFGSKMKQLVQHQAAGNRQLAAKKIDLARRTYADCNRLVSQVEEIILIQELLGSKANVTEDELKQILSVRSESRALWQKRAETMAEAAAQLADKLALSELTPGAVQINALMLDDSYQYSQFSSRFRPMLESALADKTGLTPLLLGETAFRPHSSGLARRAAADGAAAYLLTGSYFAKEDEVHFYVRLSRTATSEVVATADGRMALKGAAGLELKPKNFLEVLKDRRVFASRDLVGGGLSLEVWTNRGTDGLALADGDDILLYARVNKPCYLRFIYHLANGARVIPDPLYLNYAIGRDKVNKVVELPGEFEACPPFGSETMQFFASTVEFPEMAIVTRVFDGESYEVLGDSLAQSNVRHRGLRRKKAGAEVAETRLPLTTVPK
ncbi:MAG: hypothetical protein HN919_11510 [Verrucomicrobia bacterium]|jgi:hypothetical protein|nr:hypothetical protein [Verrucomicrobiota bacterium]MBT7066922.1 hypothetical protein [Verrucomicrobiota bacterium]MBT7699112.1 hypothetical protein [Verrucomicrobiota bacterium]